MRGWLAVAVLLAGCGHREPSRKENDPGARLEAAAIDAGVIADPADTSLTGVWTRDTDRLCIVPGRGTDSSVGIMIDQTDARQCVLRGTIRRLGNTAQASFGRCRFDVSLGDGRIAFPETMPSRCTSLCQGHARFSTATFERLSRSMPEAALIAAPDGRRLCRG